MNIEETRRIFRLYGTHVSRDGHNMWIYTRHELKVIHVACDNGTVDEYTCIRDGSVTERNTEEW